MTILLPIIALGALGLIFGLGLAFASLKLAVDEDPNLKKVLELLPGLNCGACGKAGCSAFAEGLLKHEVAVNGCLPGGKKVADELGHVLGLESTGAELKRAVVHCGTDFDNRTRIAQYQGVKSCSAAILLQGAGFACGFSCLGFGDCAKECPFGAINMSKGKPIIDYDKCTGCGICAKICPRSIISIETLRKDSDLAAVACRSYEKGARVRKICNVGCIGCKICEKKVPEVFSVGQNLAKINYDKPDPETKWDEAVNACPQKTIVKLLSKAEVNKLIASNTT